MTLALVAICFGSPIAQADGLSGAACKALTICWPGLALGAALAASQFRDRGIVAAWCGAPVGAVAWLGAGFVPAFKGALGTPAGGCTLTVRIEPGIANPLPAKFAAITGDKEVPSSNSLMRRARPQVSEWTQNYQ
ncbi:MAG: hypothetical protein HXX15_17540 [Rhodopseudomonas sp.]|uniref:hypothetical protein n=1 Tax=Rhodopseudomonas sp. TaxID=1078 RepID=UPI001804CF97|nr:hypothetical protein [Rhodopseudomonas sp.]NVN87884.1 hypothetical protein [Rhodopseudomonas sp.]